MFAIWYNPIKGHAQYSLRDERRDRHSGRIWRIVPKGTKLADPPKIAGEPLPRLLDLLKRPEYRYRYWAKRELRECDPDEVLSALKSWTSNLAPADPRHRHHQVEAMWLAASLDRPDADLIVELLNCEVAEARAAATRQLRYWWESVGNGLAALRSSANDDDAIVRMEAAIAASYIGTEEALEALLDTLKHNHGQHLSYAIRSSLGSETMKPMWENNEAINAAHPELKTFLADFEKAMKTKPVKKSAKESQFDSQKNLKTVEISCVKEQMLFTVKKFEVQAGQPVKIVFTNPDATQHNLVILKPGKDHIETIGMAANEMAKSPDGLKQQFLPKSNLILQATNLLNPESTETLRFTAPEKPGVYPYLCTFPGHWILMRGEMVVK